MSDDGATDADAEPDDGDPDADAEPESESEPERPLGERVAEHDEALGAEVRTLREERDALAADLEETEADLEEFEEQLKRTQADFQNYKKRAEKRREQVEKRATEELVERLLDVRDNLARALDAGDGGEDITGGVEATLREFDRVLDEEGVERIEPDPGAEVDPERHEVMMRVDSDTPEDTVAELYRPGYEMGEKVLRPAQVTVSEAEAEAE
jgi:molecular chaperone GrpE